MTGSPSPPGRPVHLGFAARQGAGQIPHQSAQARGTGTSKRHRQRRLRGHFPPEAEAAGASSHCSPPAIRRSIRATWRRRRCVSTRSAPVRSNSSPTSRTSRSASPATRITGSRAGPISTASSGRSFRTARRRSSPSSAGQLDMTFPYEVTIAAAEGHQEPGAGRGLRVAAARRRQHADRQPRRAALRQSRAAPGDGADARPQVVHRRAQRRPRPISARRCCRRPRGCGACRRRPCGACRATTPTLPKSRAEARQIMQRLGYGPDNPLAVKVATRNIPLYRDPAVHADRPAEGDLHRRRTRHRRDRELEPEGHARATTWSGWKTPATRSSMTPTSSSTRSYRSATLDRNFTGYCNRELEERFHQPIGRDRPGQDARSWSGTSTAPCRKRAPDRSSFHRRGATCWQPAAQGPDDDGQQHVQRLATRRRVARGIGRPVT